MARRYGIRRGRVLAVAGVACLLAACQASRVVLEHFDSSTGATWAVAREAISFARTESQYSRSARDYVYLGPVELNLRGRREYFLWLGMATTLDRGFLAPEPAAPRKLFLDMAGAPLELELGDWAERAPELAGIRLYSPSVRPSIELAARITVDQLRHLSESETESLAIETGGGDLLEFRLWQERPGWDDFLAHAAGP